MADVKIGHVTHYYDKIGVAIVELSGDLSVSDTIKFVRGGEELFSQRVGSMQSEHKNIETAASGDIIGIKTDQEVKDGAEVHKTVE